MALTRHYRHQGVSLTGTHHIQSAVLELPRVDIDLILQAQQTWADKYGKGRWYQHCIPWEDDPTSLGHSHQGGVDHFNARECFEVDYQQALQWPAFAVEMPTWGTRDVHPKTRIPTDLITGPWDEERQRRLFWLCRGGMNKYPGDDPPPWEVKILCLRNLVLDVSEPNVLVLNCILRSWVFEGLPQDVVRKELLNLERRLEWGGDTPEGRHILRGIRMALELFLRMPDFQQ